MSQAVSPCILFYNRELEEYLRLFSLFSKTKNRLFNAFSPNDVNASGTGQDKHVDKRDLLDVCIAAMCWQGCGLVLTAQLVRGGRRTCRHGGSPITDAFDRCPREREVPARPLAVTGTGRWPQSITYGSFWYEAAKPVKTQMILVWIL